MGKWSPLEGKLPKLQPASDDDPKFQEKVNAVKDEIKAEYGSLTPAYLAQKLIAAKKDKAEKEAEVKAAFIQQKAIEQLLAAVFEQEGQSAVRMADGTNVSKSPDLTIQIKDLDKFNDWCRENGFERQMRLLPQTALSIVKELVEEGRATPDGVLVGLFDKFYVTKR